MGAKRKRSDRESLIPALWRRRRLLGWGAAVPFSLAALVLAGDAAASARAFLRNQARPAVAVRAPAGPAWTSIDPAAAIRQELARRHSSGLSAADVGRAFEQSSWVRSARVRRTREGFRVDLDYRRPILAVAWGDRCCYVDRDGVALDVDSLAEAAAAECLTLEGIEARGRPSVGRPIPDPRVVAAARLTDEIGVLSSPLGLDRIHCEAVGGRQEPHFVLAAQNGARIFWGAASAQSEQKIGRLRQIVAGGEMIPPGGVLDLRSPLEVSRSGSDWPGEKSS